MTLSYTIIEEKTLPYESLLLQKLNKHKIAQGNEEGGSTGGLVDKTKKSWNTLKKQS